MRELDLYSDAPSDAKPRPLSTSARRELDLYDGVTPVQPVPVPHDTPAGSEPSTGRTAPASRVERPQDWIDDLWRGFTPAVRERFEPRQVIGEGGMGVVIEAYDRLMNRIVAIKGPRDPRHMSAASRERQVKEAQISARLMHPNILPVYDLWTDARGNAWCSMLRVPGEAPTLGTRLARLEGTPIDKRPLNCLLRTFHETCMAVWYAHRAGFLHRDLKPENIFLAEAEESLALVADWGVAIEKDAAAHGIVDRVGTRGYAAPEQLGLLGDTRCDERSDVYSLGILLYEMVVGRRFVRGSSVHSSSSSIPEEAPPPPPIPELVPRELAAIIRRATSWDPAGRHPTVLALIDEVDTYQQGGLLEGLEYDSKERLAKWSRAHPWTAGAAATGLIAGVILAAFSYMLFHKSVWLCKRLASIYAEKAANARAAHDADLANHYAALALATWPQKYLMPTPTPYSALAESGKKGRHLWSRKLEVPSGCVAFAPDGRTIAVAGKDGVIELWDAKTAKRQRVLDGHTRTVRALAFSANGLLASAGDDGVVRVWEKDGRARPPLTGHTGAVHSLAFSPTGNRIATAGADGKVRVWRLDLAAPGLFPIAMPTSGAGSLALDEELDKLFVTAADGTLPMVSLSSRAFVGNITPCHGGLRLITYIPSRGGASPRRLIAFAGVEPDANTVVRLWDLTYWREWGQLHHDRPVTAIHLTPDRISLVSGSADGSVRVWDIDSRKVLIELTGHAGDVSALSISPDARLLASVGADGTLRLWDIRTGAQSVGLEKPLHGTSHHVWTADDAHVIELPRTAGDATIWNAVTRSRVTTQPLGGVKFEAAPVVSPDGGRVAGVHDRRLMVYEIKKGAPPRLELLGNHVLPPEACAIGFTSGGRLLVGLATATALKVYDLADGRTLTEVFWPRGKAGERPRTVVIGTDADLIAAAGADGRAWAWRPRTAGRNPVPIELASGAARATMVAIAPRGGTVAVGDETGEILLWKPGQSRHVRLDAHRTPVATLAFSADGTRLISTATSPAARIWSLSAWQDPAEVLEHLNRTSPYEHVQDALVRKTEFRDDPWFPPDYTFPEVGR